MFRLKLWILKELIFSNMGHPVSHHHPSDLSVTLNPSLYYTVTHISKSSIHSAIRFLSSTTICSKNQVQNGVWCNPARSEWFLASNHEVATSHKKENKKQKKREQVATTHRPAPHLPQAVAVFFSLWPHLASFDSFKERVISLESSTHDILPTRRENKTESSDDSGLWRHTSLLFSARPGVG